MNDQKYIDPKGRLRYADPEKQQDFTVSRKKWRDKLNSELMEDPFGPC